MSLRSTGGQFVQVQEQLDPASSGTQLPHSSMPCLSSSKQPQPAGLVKILQRQAQPHPATSHTQVSPAVLSFTAVDGTVNLFFQICMGTYVCAMTLIYKQVNVHDLFNSHFIV